MSTSIGQRRDLTDAQRNDVRRGVREAKTLLVSEALAVATSATKAKAAAQLGQLTDAIRAGGGVKAMSKRERDAAWDRAVKLAVRAERGA